MHQIIVADSVQDAERVRRDLWIAGIEIPRRETFSLRSADRFRGLRFDIAYAYHYTADGTASDPWIRRGLREFEASQAISARDGGGHIVWLRT